MNIQVKWIPEKLNRAANHVVNLVRKSTVKKYQIEKRWEKLDKTITDQTWVAMYGGSQVITREEQKRAEK